MKTSTTKRSRQAAKASRKPTSAVNKPAGMVTKFSGVKDHYVGGATRDAAAGKGRYDLISVHMLRRLAGVYERGAENHGDSNWLGGIPFSRLFDSALRHIEQAKAGMVDEDHLCQAIWNLSAAVHFQEEGREEELNDLPKLKNPRGLNP